MMEKILITMTTLLLLSGCGNKKEDSARETMKYSLQGAWTLRHVKYPMGAEEDYDLKGSGTSCLIYEGDSVLYGCRIASTPSGLVILPMAKAAVTLIDKGGSELLYLENDDPHPLTISDSTITIQRNGALYSYIRADGIYWEWGTEIRDIIARDIDNGGDNEASRYMLSARERQQEKTIHWFSIFTVLIVFAALLAVRLAIINRRAKRQLLLQLQQIREVQENRPQAVRQVVATVENEFFTSSDYAALQRRMASGQLMKEQDWQQVEQHLKTLYPGFTSQLRSLYPMSELEYQTCLLIKLRIAPKDIAAVLARDMSTISTVRSRLYKKVFGHKGGTKEWDDFILTMGA